MNTRLRLLVIGIGALLIVATYTFPLWYAPDTGSDEVLDFPELPPSLRDAYIALAPQQQQAYLDLRAANPTLALQMATSALDANTVAPLDEQTQPQFEGQQMVLEGAFTPISSIRSAEGRVEIYQLPDGSRYLWLSDFVAIDGPGLRLYLSTANTLTLQALRDDDEDDNDELGITIEDVRLDSLRYSAGAHAYDVPREIDLSRYSSVLIYSDTLNLVYAIADLE